MRIEQEKTKLEDRVQDLEKNIRNQGRILEQVTSDYEEEVRRLKDTIRR